MVDVSEWARREAEKRYPQEHYYGNLDECEAAQEAGKWGIERLAALLLSDEAVSALAEKFYDAETGTVGRYPTTWYRAAWENTARAALLAAVSAVTTTDPDMERAERFHAGSTEADYAFGPEVTTHPNTPISETGA
jgi:hypothetical protein